MAPLSTIRANKGSWGRLILSVFVVVWMNAALQPCLMAMEMSSGEEAATSVHAGHDSMLADSGDSVVPSCQHCPPSMSSGNGHCPTLEMSGCDLLPDVKQSDRVPKLDLGDACFVAIVNDNYSFSLHQPYVPPFSCDSVRPNYSIGPPINLKNCVFLK